MSLLYWKVWDHGPGPETQALHQAPGWPAPALLASLGSLSSCTADANPVLAAGVFLLLLPLLGIPFLQVFVQQAPHPLGLDWASLSPGQLHWPPHPGFLLTVPTHTLSISSLCCISEHHIGSNTVLATYFKIFIASFQKEGSQKAGILPVLFNPEAPRPSTGLAYNKSSTHFF